MNVNIEKLNDKKVGDVIYLFADGTNMQRRYRGEPLENQIIETTVIKAGRKYITVEYHNVQFDKSDYSEKTNYCADYYLYADKQDIYDLKEKQSLFSMVSSKLGRSAYSCPSDISLDQLRRIKVILEED